MAPYTYSEYTDFNRFINLDSIEAKVVEHLIHSTSKYANTLWQLLANPGKDALWRPVPTVAERTALVEGTITATEGGDLHEKRILFKPFSDDAVKEECSVLCIYVSSVQPLDAMQGVVTLIVELATHNHINVVTGEADFIAHPDITNPNDYYYNDNETPTVQCKSRETLLLKSVLAELNGLFIDGVGYLQFHPQKTRLGQVVGAAAGLTVYDGRSFFGHRIQFNIPMAGVSGNTDEGW